MPCGRTPVVIGRGGRAERELRTASRGAGRLVVPVVVSFSGVSCDVEVFKMRIQVPRGTTGNEFVFIFLNTYFYFFSPPLGSVQLDSAVLLLYQYHSPSSD